LQRSIGNRAASALLQQQGHTEGAALRRSAIAERPASHGARDEQQGEQTLSAGQPLAESVRTPLEGMFDASFSKVRVHTDAGASTVSRAMNARAVTVGDDIYFGEGQFNPHTTDGRELLGHELTHVSHHAEGGKAHAARLDGQHQDADEQDAQAVGKIIGLAGLQTPAPAHGGPAPGQMQVMRQVHGIVQRAGGGKAKRVAKSVGKGFLMSLANAVTGPFQYIYRRKDMSEQWKDMNQSGPGEAYANDHLARMAKAATVIKEMGTMANWVALLTGVGSLIAAAFAPAGLLAAAVLGTISGIASLVNMALGVISGGLSTILAIANLKRALALPKGSADRKRIMLTFYKDLAGALSGVLAAASGVAGLGLSGWSPTQTVSSVSDSLGKSGIGGAAAMWGTQTGVNQAFNTADEMQSGGLTTKPKSSPTPPTTPPPTTTTTPTTPPPTTTTAPTTSSTPPSTPPPPVPTRVSSNPPSTPPPPVPTTTTSSGPPSTPPPPVPTTTSRGPTRQAPPRPTTTPPGVTTNGPRRLPPPPPPQTQPVISLLRVDRLPSYVQREGEEKEGSEDEDISGQLMSELDKAGGVGRDSSTAANEDKGVISSDLSQVKTAGASVDSAGVGLAQVEEVKTVSTKMNEMGEKSEQGASDVDAKNHGKLTRKDLTESKAEDIKSADAGIDRVEAAAGEPIGEKTSKKGFVGTVGAWLKRGFNAVKNFFMKGFLGLKSRIKALFAKIKAKAVTMAIRSAGLTESVEALKGSVAESKASQPEAESLATEAKDETEGVEGQAGELQTTVQHAKELVGSGT
ncbi:MAG TPA: DUF4157 domain-containing protein, partial [Chloroflexia bacterium]|nr:DUF4157 domain-containing protein [Chloroflexia bacterium]